MTDITVEIDAQEFDEKLNIDVPQAPKASDETVISFPPCALGGASADDKRDAWSLLSDIDPASGLPYAWLDILEELTEGGPAKALPMIYEYYMERNPNMDSYMNYLLACSHFTKEELGDPTTKGARRRLELRIKKAIKKNKGPIQNFRQFYHEHGAELLKDD